jgi:hypothetical protein
MLIDGYWLTVKDGDPGAFDIMRRHYTFHPYRDNRRLVGRNRRLFVGPGGKMVLVTIDFRALFVWRKFISDDGQEGVNCAMFRNESSILSSSLILAAEAMAWLRWPGERLYTYVNPRKIRSTNPGFCFIKAGWRKCGASADGLVILEKIPRTPQAP